MLREVERALESEHLPKGRDFWHEQILEARATEDLDDLTVSALAQFLPGVDPNWLRREAKNQYRLDDAFLQKPLHIVSGIRVGTAPLSQGPQRFGRMLLLAQDHLAKRAEFDFFEGAMLLPELAILGNSLEEIGACGPEAVRKLASLPGLHDDLVTSTIYELLVGAACIRRGLDVEMLPEDRSKKVPDFRLTGIGAIPGSIECKRRLGLSNYELEEARQIECLYEVLRPSLHEGSLHCSIEAVFQVPPASVQPRAFVHDILTASSLDKDTDTTLTSWGSVAVRRLPYYNEIEGTRLYSPNFLRDVFSWDLIGNEWDGLLCEVEPPRSILVSSYRMPMCLKWRSESDGAFVKKSRGIASLWNDAIKQLSPGDFGFVYIAYPEGGRPAIADARTRHILKSMSESWHHWYIRVPVTVISRLYPRPVGVGCPDLIESSLPGAARGNDVWLTKLPWLVFTRQFEE
jgi:hypothetical protein